MSEKQLIDHDALAALQEVLEDDFQQLIDTFIGDSRANLVAMQKALAADDSDTLRRAAHSLKGSCSNIGAAGLMQTSLDIEARAHRGDLQGVEHLLVELQGEFQQVQQQLEVYR